MIVLLEFLSQLKGFKELPLASEIGSTAFLFCLAFYISISFDKINNYKHLNGLSDLCCSSKPSRLKGVFFKYYLILQFCFSGLNINKAIFRSPNHISSHSPNNAALEVEPSSFDLVFTKHSIVVFIPSSFQAFKFFLSNDRILTRSNNE